MSTIALIKEAILALKDRTGSSVIAINKWIETEKKVGALALVIVRRINKIWTVERLGHTRVSVRHRRALLHGDSVFDSCSLTDT